MSYLRSSDIRGALRFRHSTCPMTKALEGVRSKGVCVFVCGGGCGVCVCVWWCVCVCDGVCGVWVGVCVFVVFVFGVCRSVCVHVCVLLCVCVRQREKAREQN